MPAAIELSTGLTDEACTRTRISVSAGIGSGRSLRRAGWVSDASRVMARMGRVSLAAHEAAADDELAGGAQDSERAPGHGQVTVVGLGDALDLQLAVDLAHGRVELERDLPAGGVQLPAQARVSPSRWALSETNPTCGGARCRRSSSSAGARRACPAWCRGWRHGS